MISSHFLLPYGSPPVATSKVKFITSFSRRTAIEKSKNLLKTNGDKEAGAGRHVQQQEHTWEHSICSQLKQQPISLSPFKPTRRKHITDGINDTSYFILIYTFCLISSDGLNGRDSAPLSFPTQPWHWQEMVYFNWKLAKQNKGKRIPEWGPFLRELLCRWIMHMGESKQQPWALLGEQWAAHSPTRAPDFITGLSIPLAWELWDLGQAAAADRSTLTQHSQQPEG